MSEPPAYDFRHNQSMGSSVGSSSEFGDEESGRSSANNASIEVGDSAAYNPERTAKTSMAAPTFTSQGGENFTPDMDDFSKQEAARPNSRRKRFILIGAVLILLVAVGAGLGAVMAGGGGGGDDNGGSKSAANENNPSTPNNETPAPTPGATPPPTEPKATPEPTHKPTKPPSPRPTPAPFETEAPTTEIYAFIKPKLPDGGLSLLFEESYQSKALVWVEDNYVAGAHNQDRIIQRFVLVCIWFATNEVESPWTRFQFGEGGVFFDWLKKTGWLDQDNFPDECDWWGVTCNDDGLVTELDFSSNLLTGSFPPETALLKGSLTRLILKNNMMYNTGEKGVNWLGELTLLEDLDLSSTSFHYSGIPTAIGNLHNLVDLDVSYSLMFGPLRDEVFADLKQLQYLYIGGNSYNSSLPPSIGDLPNLWYFYADYCDLEGDLSLWAYPEKLPYLYELWIDKNPKITGQIPVELSYHENLASLSLTELGIDGPIPTEMGLLTEMQQMWLFGNKLNGAIPAELSNMTKLARLELEKNDLAGPMPTDICLEVFPRGLIQVLEADCVSPNPQVGCPYPDCCTCCGEECADNEPKPLQGGGSQGGDVRRPGGRQLASMSKEERRALRHEERRESIRLLKDPVFARQAAAKRAEKLAFHSAHQH